MLPLEIGVSSPVNTCTDWQRDVSGPELDQRMTRAVGVDGDLT